LRKLGGFAASISLVFLSSGCAFDSPPAKEPIASPPVVANPSVPVHAAVAPRPLHIALALGGGAARGFAHIGVIKALEARGIYPDIIVGTSAGAVVGALYASGASGLELNRMALTADQSAFSDWTLPGRGFFKGEALEKYVNDAVKDRPIEALTRKLAVCATDLQSGQLMVFERGNTGLAVRASASVPGVFQPTRIGDREYVDGGLVSPVPVRVARQLGADVVIAVDISARPLASDTSGLVGELLQTFAIMSQTIAAYEEKDADVILKPDLPRVGGSDFASRNASVLAGEEAVARHAIHIQDVIATKQKVLAGN